MDLYKGMPVLVTGGCGFIGSHLAHELVTQGAHVTILDNCSTGTVANIAPFKDDVVFIQKSITDPEVCLEATKGQHIIFHLAALVSVPLSLDNPALCHQTNVEGTFNILEAARLNGVQRCVFSSSAAVYGPQPGICSEQLPCKPRSPYGYSKWLGELYCQQYAQVYGLQTVSLRYFNVYGPRQNPRGHYASAVAKFKECMKHNQSIVIFGNGQQTRDFIPVADVVQANLTLGMVKLHKSGDVYNVATGTSITLLNLIEHLKEEYPDYNAPLIFNAPRPGDIHHSAADCSKYKTILSPFALKEVR